MRIINVSEPVAQPRITALCYGGTRAGKTRFAASFPRPLFLSDVTESGWTTIQTMDRSFFYEENRIPIVWGIESISDMAEASNKMEPLIAKGDVNTVVIDSLTFYADLYFNHLLTAMGGRPDTRRAYGDLNNHLRDLRVRMHQKRVNVIWTALDKQPDSENPVGGPMIPGQQATKFAAGCDFIFYHRQFQEGQSGPKWEVRTRRYGPYVAGGRDGGALPDPLNPSYRDLMDGLRAIDSVYDPIEPGTATAAPVQQATVTVARPNNAPSKPASAARRVVTTQNR